MEVLGSYGIDIIQVYSNTTDNAMSMTKCRCLMYDDIVEVLNNENEHENDEQNFLYETFIEENITSEMNKLSFNRSGAHIFALAIEDVLKMTKKVRKH